MGRCGPGTSIGAACAVRAAAERRRTTRSSGSAAALPDRFALITQNVDGLHRRAGSPDAQTFPIHGDIDADAVRGRVHARSLADPRRRRRRSRKGDGRARGDAQALLVCPRCGGMARPHVLWFDESYDEPRFHLDTVAPARRPAALLVVAGTSAQTNLPWQVVHARRARRRHDRRRQRRGQPVRRDRGASRAAPCVVRPRSIAAGARRAPVAESHRFRAWTLRDAVIGQGVHDGLRRTTASPSRSRERAAPTLTGEIIDAAARGGREGHRRDPRDRRDARRGLRGRRARRAAARAARGRRSRCRRCRASCAPPARPRTTRALGRRAARRVAAARSRRARRRPARAAARGRRGLLHLAARRRSGRAAPALPPRPAPAVDAHARARRRRRRDPGRRRGAPHDAARAARRADPQGSHRAARVRRGRGRRPDVDALRAAAPADDRRRGDQLPAAPGARQARDDLRTRTSLDPEQRLLGVVSFRDLFAAEPEEDRRRDHGDRRRARHRRDGSGDGVARCSPSTTSTSSRSSTPTAR